MDKTEKFSFGAFLAALGGVLAVWLPVLLLHLTVVLFSALITYAAARAAASWLSRRRPDMPRAALWGLLLVLVLMATAAGLLGFWLEHRADGLAIGSLSEKAAAVLEQLHTTLPAGAAEYVPASVANLKESSVHVLKSHALALQTAGAHTLRAIGYVLAGVIIGGIAVLQVPAQPPAGARPLAQILRGGFDELLRSFTDVFFAQIRIAAINTALTSVYLLVVLPLMGRPLPMTDSLVLLTFLAGLIPVVGNLVSNSFIVVLSLGDSMGITLLSLAWLIGIHKLEYFLNAHIIGHKIKAAAWELLIAMLVMEAAFGLAGLVSAPVIYAQIKRVMGDKGWV